MPFLFVRQNVRMVWTHNPYVTVSWLSALVIDLPFVCVVLIQVNVIYRWINLLSLIRPLKCNRLLHLLRLALVLGFDILLFGWATDGALPVLSFSRHVLVYKPLLGVCLFLVLPGFRAFLQILDSNYAHVFDLG